MIKCLRVDFQTFMRMNISYIHSYIHTIPLHITIVLFAVHFQTTSATISFITICVNLGKSVIGFTKDLILKIKL
jgi:hypothetical protein